MVDKKDIAVLFNSGKNGSMNSKILKSDKAKGNQSEYNWSESALNNYGVELMEQNELQKALVVFRLNVEFNPKSFNAYDSLGECLLKMGKKKEGIAAYKQSLELDPDNRNAAEMVKKIETQR